MMGEVKSGFSQVQGVFFRLGGDAVQVQHAAGGGAAQEREKSHGTVGDQNIPHCGYGDIMTASGLRIALPRRPAA